MANYARIMRVRPEVREFLRNRSWVLRGEVVGYGANIRCQAFSTDPAGFRHTVFQGEALSVHQILERPRYGLVLGPSNGYGFGVAGNENTIASVLSERFGFPFGNVSLPEGSSRNLFSLLIGFLSRAPRPPVVVLHLSGGDFTNFCYTSIAHPVFGSPNLKQMQMALDERGGAPPAEGQLPFLLAFTTLWLQAIGSVCRDRRIPLVIGDDATFFEKEEPTELEKQCELGVAPDAAKERQFATHRRFVRTFHERRTAVAKSLGAPLSGPGFGHDITFVDEFHYDAAGTRNFCNYFGNSIEELLRLQPHKARSGRRSGKPHALPPTGAFDIHESSKGSLAKQKVEKPDS